MRRLVRIVVRMLPAVKRFNARLLAEAHAKALAVP